MSRNLLLKYLLALLILLVVSLLSAPVTKYLIHEFLPKGDNDWIGYGGNIVGGILGGVCTLLGVAYAFNLEKNKAFKETIPNKIVNLYSLKQEIGSHKFVKNYGEATNWQKSVENMQLFRNQIEGFYKLNQEFLEKASEVDSDTFAAVERYYYGLKTVMLKIDKLTNASGLSVEDIQQEISKATNFQFDLLEIMLSIFQERQKHYINYLHNQKMPGHIISKFNNHEYIQDIIRESSRQNNNS